MRASWLSGRTKVSVSRRSSDRGPDDAWEPVLAGDGERHAEVLRAISGEECEMKFRAARAGNRKK
jgi:hypothetical protein